MVKSKNYNIETLRGLAILLVVAGHVIGSAPESGMKIAYPSLLRYIYLYIDYIQMPLFTAIAGWAYALKPITKNNLRNFFKKKAIRILIPLFAVSTLYYIMQSCSSGVNSTIQIKDIWIIYIRPYSVYWYLGSLFIMFCFISAIDIYKLMDTRRKWIIVITISVFVVIVNVLFNDTFNLFSYRGAINQFPYFILGVGITRFSKFKITKLTVYLSIIATIIAIGVINQSWFTNDIYNIYFDITNRILVIGSLLLLFQLKYTSNIFVYFGKYSYSIYLYHIFFTGGVRLILLKLGFNSIFWLFCVTFIIASIMPILIEKVFRLNRFTQMFFLGIKPKNN